MWNQSLSMVWQYGLPIPDVALKAFRDVQLILLCQITTRQANVINTELD